MSLLHSVTRLGANITRRGVKALRGAPGMGPTNVRRNSLFWTSLAEIQNVAVNQTYVRDVTSVKFVRASIRLSAAIAPAQSKYGLSLGTGTRNWLEINRARAMDPALDVCRAALGIRQPRMPVNLAAQAVADGIEDVVLRSALVYGHDPKLDVAALARKTVASRPRAIVPRVSEETARALTTIDTSGLRHYLDGRSICLIANSQRVGQSGAGALIDGYDIVARFNSFKIDPQHTGSKTSIHAAIHMHNFNWSVPVDVRLIFSGSLDAWRNSINKYNDPQAQTYLGDPTLRWPVRGGNLLGETDVVDVPTSGFNLMRLVDFLDVSTKIDLIGFDFNASGAYRLDSAMSLPVARAHDYSAERDWVMKNATEVGDLVISLR